jgi:hypothetical protein
VTDFANINLYEKMMNTKAIEKYKIPKTYSFSHFYSVNFVSGIHTPISSWNSNWKANTCLEGLRKTKKTSGQLGNKS